MAHPKHRHSRSRRDKRRTHDALTPPTLTPCPSCHEPKLPHAVCPSCGTYRGRQVITVTET